MLGVSPKLDEYGNSEVSGFLFMKGGEITKNDLRLFKECKC